MIQHDQNPIYKTLTLFILPAFIALMCVAMKIATGPYWLGVNSDPAYLYLINSLYLVDGVAPIFTDHPGAPLEVLGAFVIWIFNSGASHDALLDAVFNNAEFYLHVLYGIVLFLFVASQAALVRYTYQKTQSLVFSAAIQVPAFIWLTTKAFRSTDYILPIVSNINSETLMIAVLNLFVMGLIKLYVEYGKTPVSCGFAFGVVAGLALSIKFTFLPLVLIPLALLPKWIQKGLYVITVPAAFVFFTLPIRENYQRMFGWVHGLVSKSGFHGSGKSQMIDPDVYFRALQWLMTGHWMIVLLLIGMMIIVGRQLVHREWKKETSFLIVLTLTMIIHFLMVAKQPAYQYMTPMIALIGLSLAMLIQLSSNKKRGAYGIAILIAFLGLKAMYYGHQLGVNNSDLVRFYQEVESNYTDCVVFPYYRGSSPYYALEFGDNVLNYNQYGAELQKRFPRKYFYNRWNRTLQTFDKNVFLQTVMPESKCALMYGAKGELDNNSFFQLEEIKTVRQDGLYQIRHSLHDQAHIGFIKARELKSAGNITAARKLTQQLISLGHPNAPTFLQELDHVQP